MSILCFIVNDLLPKETELKVRYQPLSDGEVVGYLRRNDVIECLAVIGDWLQVRYGKEDAAWVRWRITPSASKSAGLLPSLTAAMSLRSTGREKRVTFSAVDTFRKTFSGPLATFSTTTLSSSSIAGASTVSDAQSLAGTFNIYASASRCS
jgi:hypothetical protein